MPIMPVYSGFSTRQQEQNYNRLIEGTLRILAGRILKFYEQFAEDDSLFMQLLSKNVSFLALMEQTKNQPPKLSESLKEICEFLKIQIPSNHIQSLNQGSNNRRSIEYQNKKELTILTRNNSAFNRSKQDSPSIQSRQAMRTLQNDKSSPRRVSSPLTKNNISANIQGGNVQRQRNTNSPQPKGCKFPQQIIQKNNKLEFSGNEDYRRRSFKGNQIQSVRHRTLSISVNERETLKQIQNDSKQGAYQSSAFNTIDVSNKELVNITKDFKQVDATSSQIQRKLQDRFGMRDQIKQINKNPLPPRLPNSVRSSPTSREPETQYPQIVRPQVNSYVISSQNKTEYPSNLDNLQISIKTYSIQNNIS